MGALTSRTCSKIEYDHEVCEEATSRRLWTFFAWHFIRIVHSVAAWLLFSSTLRWINVNLREGFPLTNYIRSGSLWKNNAFCYQADGVGFSKLVRFLFGLFVTIIRKNKKKTKTVVCFSANLSVSYSSCISKTLSSKIMLWFILLYVMKPKRSS